jgi:catalase
MISRSVAPISSNKRSPSGSAAGCCAGPWGVSVANPGDPTEDPSKAWPEDRRAIEVDTLTVQQIEAERDGPCRDINFDPTVLPPGMRTSDNPFPAARSVAYAKSYDRRTAEAKDYPRTATDAKP